MRKNKAMFAVLAVLLSAGVAASPVAAASGMDIDAGGGGGTHIDRDGTQGDLAPAVQGTTDDDGYQNAYLKASEQAAPQFTASQK